MSRLRSRKIPKIVINWTLNGENWPIRVDGRLFPSPKVFIGVIELPTKRELIGVFGVSWLRNSARLQVSEQRNNGDKFETSYGESSRLLRQESINRERRFSRHFLNSNNETGGRESFVDVPHGRNWVISTGAVGPPARYRHCGIDRHGYA